MGHLRLDAALFDQGLAFLAAADPDLARAIALCGRPPLRESEAGFVTLLQSIVAQQVSVHAARSIWDRLALSLGTVSPETVAAASEAMLRAAGLSGQKIRYGQGLAAAIVEGRLDLDAIHELADEEAIVELVKAKGIGRWTAEIYLMFALRRPDILPSADLGLLVALQSLKSLPLRPTPMEFIDIAAPWRPWRSVASLVLWHYRHNMPDFAAAPKLRRPRAASRSS